MITITTTKHNNPNDIKNSNNNIKHNNNNNAHTINNKMIIRITIIIIKIFRMKIRMEMGMSVRTMIMTVILI